MPGVHAAFEPARPRISGDVAAMFPGQAIRKRWPLIDRLLGKFDQTARDAMSAQGKPVPDSLPETDRPTEIWVDTNVEPRWGYAMNPHYEGVPITFYPPQHVNPQIHAGYGPFVQYPPIDRGNPIPYGDTVPTVGA